MNIYRRLVLPTISRAGKYQLSLRGRLSLLLIVMVLPFICFAIYQSVEISNRFEREAQTESLQIAKNVAASLDDYITSTGEVLIPIANNESVRDRDYPKIKTLLDRVLLKYPYYDSLSFIDINGIRQVMSKRNDTQGNKTVSSDDQPVGELAFFKRGVVSEGISIGDFRYCSITRKPIVHITYPISDRSEKKVGLVVAAFDLTKLQDKLLSPEIPDHVEIGVIDNSGVIIARNRDPETFIGKNISNELVFKNMLGLDEGTDKVPAPDNVTRAFGFAKASRVPWYVRAGVDAKYIQQQARAEFIHQFSVFIPFLLLSILGWFWVGKDVDRVHNKTDRLSLIDPLTGLWNLRKLHQDLDHEFNRAKRHNDKLSFAMIDIDFFKHYNDQNGHQAGDEALRLVSELIRKSVRDADIAYRYGGEEMCVLLSSTDKDGASYLAERIRRSIERFDFAGGKRQPNGRLTVSIGVATYPDDSAFKDGLVKSADVALYQAKHMGRNRVEAYSDGAAVHEKRREDVLRATGNSATLREKTGSAQEELEPGLNDEAVSALQITDKASLALEYHDSLTGLPNRTLFIDRLSTALTHAERYGEMIAVLCVDIDNSRTINNTLGYSVGDELVRSVAERLTGRLRKSDTVALFSGDKLVIILRQVEHQERINTVAHGLLEDIKRPFNIDGHEIHITASMGISFYPNDGEDAQTLLINADSALKLAKEQGKGIYQFYALAMDEENYKRFEVVNRIHGALERNEFILHYQPLVETSSGTIAGAEALLRWQHPELGLVPPMDFIPIAEETGLIGSIGEWVLRTACRQNKQWQDAGYMPITVSVNISARQFQQDDLADMVSQVLRETGLDSKYLELEITESTVMKDADRAVSVLQELDSMGIQVSVDDFGTGYSSLSYLRQFPVKKLKIDRSFIHALETNPDEPAIVMAIIALAHSLNLTSVAEGVETREQLEILRSLKCGEIQGFLFSKPLPAEEFASLIAENDSRCA